MMFSHDQPALVVEGYWGEDIWQFSSIVFWRCGNAKGRLGEAPGARLAEEP
jgi:hypothetical protein